MFALFLTLILFGALGVIVFSVGLLWLMLGESDGEPADTRGPLSLTQTIAREIEARRIWRALSTWMSAKPLRIEDRSDPNQS